MYVIGVSDWNFIKIVNRPLIMTELKVELVITSLKYEADLNDATIIRDLDEAKDILKEIQGNVKNIEFKNNSVLGEIYDKENKFDKEEYVKKLKIYELNLVLIEDGRD